MKQKDFAVGMACGVAVGMTLGLVVGAISGVLFAPASGAETRRRLQYERDQAVGAAQSQVRRTKARLHLVQPEATAQGEEEDAFSGA